MIPRKPTSPSSSLSTDKEASYHQWCTKETSIKHGASVYILLRCVLHNSPCCSFMGGAGGQMHEHTASTAHAVLTSDEALGKPSDKTALSLFAQHRCSSLWGIICACRSVCDCLWELLVKTTKHRWELEHHLKTKKVSSTWTMCSNTNLNHCHLYREFIINVVKKEDG